MGAPYIPSPEIGRKAVGYAIGHSERFGFTSERNHRQNRPENLLLRDALIVARASQQGRLDVVCAGLSSTTTRGDLYTLGARNIEIADDFLDMIGVNQWPDIGARIERVTDTYRRDSVLQTRNDVSFDALFDQ